MRRSKTRKGGNLELIFGGKSRGAHSYRREGEGSADKQGGPRDPSCAQRKTVSGSSAKRKTLEGAAGKRFDRKKVTRAALVLSLLTI